MTREWSDSKHAWPRSSFGPIPLSDAAGTVTPDAYSIGELSGLRDPSTGHLLLHSVDTGLISVLANAITSAGVDVVTSLDDFSWIYEKHGKSPTCAVIYMGNTYTTNNDKTCQDMAQLKTDLENKALVVKDIKITLKDGRIESCDYTSERTPKKK